jgi:hypothetical protein
MGGYRVQPGDPSCPYQKELPLNSSTSTLITNLQKWKPKVFTTPWDGRKSSTSNSTLHIFSVGISQYGNESGYPIQYAAASSHAIEDFFKSNQIKSNHKTLLRKRTSLAGVVQ